jgi:hypothetical protein
LTILPRILIEPELAAGSMVVIDGRMKPWVSVGGIASRSGGFQSAVLKDFIGIIKEEFSFTRDRLALAESTFIPST